MSKKLAPKKAITNTKEKDILDDAPQNELSALASEEEDMEHFPITRYQTALTDSLMTILEMLEKKNADKEEIWHEEEQRRRVEEREKEDRRREEEKREEKCERIYREEAEKREMRLLELLEFKDKANEEIQLRPFEKNKNLKSGPTWKDNDTPADYLHWFEQVMLSNEEPKDQWARILSIHLSGKTSNVFSTRIPTDICLGRHLLSSPPVYPQTSVWEGIYCLLHPYTHRHLSGKASTVFSTRIPTD